jgi:hypothetical protein
MPAEAVGISECVANLIAKSLQRSCAGEFGDLCSSIVTHTTWHEGHCFRAMLQGKNIAGHQPEGFRALITPKSKS